MKEYINEFLSYLKIEKNLSKNTIVSYENDLNQFHNYLISFYEKNDYNINEIDQRVIRDYQRTLLLNNIKKISIGRKIAAIRSFFKFLVKKQYLSKNPSIGITAPKTEKKLPVFVDEKSIEKMMRMPDTELITGLRDLAILEIFYSTGIRESELINLNFSDLYLSKNLIKVFGKGRKERIIPIGSRAKAIIEEYLERRQELFTEATTEEDKKFIFLSNHGKKFYRTGIYNIVKFYLTKAFGGEKCSPHVLRHTFATHLLNRGADIESVKQMLGHSSLSTTQIYTHVSVDHLKKIYNKAHPKANTDEKI